MTRPRPRAAVRPGAPAAVGRSAPARRSSARAPRRRLAWRGSPVACLLIAAAQGPGLLDVIGEVEDDMLALAQARAVAADPFGLGQGCRARWAAGLAPAGVAV